MAGALGFSAARPPEMRRAAPTRAGRSSPLQEWSLQCCKLSSTSYSTRACMGHQTPMTEPLQHAEQTFTGEDSFMAIEHAPRQSRRMYFGICRRAFCILWSCQPSRRASWTRNRGFGLPLKPVCHCVLAQKQVEHPLHHFCCIFSSTCTARSAYYLLPMISLPLKQQHRIQSIPKAARDVHHSTQQPLLL